MIFIAVFDSLKAFSLIWDDRSLCFFLIPKRFDVGLFCAVVRDIFFHLPSSIFLLKISPSNRLHNWDIKHVF